MIDLHMERIDAFIQFIHLLEIMIILRFKAQRPQLFQLLLLQSDLLFQLADRLAAAHSAVPCGPRSVIRQMGV